mmetsp:Transcript_63652/g.168243  ORF Transcript_63652/g.168243 Transcript_63652/m.168243 type:complete len:347 (-) Transcript_63652:452-1492(-)
MVCSVCRRRMIARLSVVIEQRAAGSKIAAALGCAHGKSARVQRTVGAMPHLCALGVQSTKQQPLRVPQLQCALQQQRRRRTALRRSAREPRTAEASPQALGCVAPRVCDGQVARAARELEWRERRTHTVHRRLQLRLAQRRPDRRLRAGLQRAEDHIARLEFALHGRRRIVTLRRHSRTVRRTVRRCARHTGWQVEHRVALGLAPKVKLAQPFDGGGAGELGGLKVADEALVARTDAARCAHHREYARPARKAVVRRLVAIGAVGTGVVEQRLVEEDARIKGVPLHREAQAQHAVACLWRRARRAASYHRLPQRRQVLNRLHMLLAEARQRRHADAVSRGLDGLRV